jgi:lysophospholipase L1-like esterase
MNKMVALRIRPAIVLFGDSITQQGFGVDGNLGWASLLASAYSRRADVLNRGFSGYNTRHALDILPRVFGTPPDEGILFCTVLFGANDSALPGERQHVPMDEYKENLYKIVTSIR